LSDFEKSSKKEKIKRKFMSRPLILVTNDDGITAPELEN
jgi:hypothetical protein